MGNEEIILIDSVLKTLNSKTILILKTNDYKNKAPFVRLDFLQAEYDELAKEVNDKIKNLLICDHLNRQLQKLIEELDQEIIIKLSSFLKKSELQIQKEKYWGMLKSKLEDIISQNTIHLIELKNEENQNIDDVELSRSEVELLMLYLREVGCVSKKISDTNLALNFSRLTGFSEKTLRQDISGISKSEKNNITDRKDNFDKLKSILNDIIVRINIDMDKINLK